MRVAKSEAVTPPKPSAFENMTRAKAEIYGLRVGSKVRQYLAADVGKEKSKEKVREGTVLQLWNHGFVVQLPTYKTFYRYNLLRRREQGERVEIVKR